MTPGKSGRALGLSDQIGENFVSVFAGRFRLEIENHAVAKRRQSNRMDVFELDIKAAFHQGANLCPEHN